MSFRNNEISRFERHPIANVFVNNSANNIAKEATISSNTVTESKPKEESLQPLIASKVATIVPVNDCRYSYLVNYKKPLTKYDSLYIPPLSTADDGLTKYVTFEPDVGGWNNIRMQMETVLIFAAATGRTLVLPPDQPMYLLNKGKGHQNEHHFADFFPFDEMFTISVFQ